MESRPPALAPRPFFRIGVTFELGLLALAALLGWIWFDDPFPWSHNLRLEAFPLGVAVLGTLPAVAWAVFATTDAGLRWEPLRGIFERIRDTMGPSIRGLDAVRLAGVALAAGIGEEALFRGVLQTYWGIGTASLIFALLHALTPAYFFLAFGISVYLGLLYRYTQFNLAVPVLVHALYDLVALLLIRRRLRAEACVAEGEDRGNTRDGGDGTGARPGHTGEADASPEGDGPAGGEPGRGPAPSGEGPRERGATGTGEASEPSGHEPDVPGGEGREPGDRAS